MNNLAEILQRLKVVDFESDLVAGKIHWKDGSGEIVASANMKAILSWAATNNSIMWAHTIGQFRDAGVPCIEPQETKNEYITDISDEEAASLATAAAEYAGANYTYRAANGANGLYLAIFDFKEGKHAFSSEEKSRRRKSAIDYTVYMMESVTEVLIDENREGEAVTLLTHFRTALGEQVERFLKDDGAYEEATKLLDSLEVCISKIRSGQKKDALEILDQAISVWNQVK